MDMPKINIKQILATWGIQPELAFVEAITDPIEGIITKPVEKLVEMIPDGIKKMEPAVDELLEEEVVKSETLTASMTNMQQQEQFLGLLVGTLPQSYLQSIAGVSTF